MGRIRGVLFDVDGTLVDSNDAHAAAWVEALAEHGFVVPFERVRRLIGMGGDKLLPAVSGLSEDDPVGHAITERRRIIFREKFLSTLEPFPGGRALVLRLPPGPWGSHRGGELGLAGELRALLRIAKVDDLLREATSSDDVDRSKSDPDTVHAALARLALEPESVVLVGDTPYDGEAGRRAGVRTIAVRSGGWSDADLAGAVAIYDDVGDLLAHYETAPLTDAGGG